MRRRSFLLGAAAFAAACTRETGPVDFPPDTTLYVVRHMDRDGSDLSEFGIARAQALVAELEGEQIDSIYSPGIPRNLDSAAPLAEARGLEIERRPQESPTRRLVREAAGRSVLWMGNKGNIRKIWEDLRLEGLPPLEYGELFVVSRTGTGPVEIDRRTFAP